MKMDGCRFDTGPSLLLFKDKYQEAFEAMGARLEDYAECVTRSFAFAEASHLLLMKQFLLPF